MRAAHKQEVIPTRTGSGSTIVTLEPGQVIYGRNSFSKSLRCPPGSLPKRIDKLLSLGNITIKSNTHFSVITVTNWASYAATMAGRKQPGNRQGTTREHIEEVKELKKDQNHDAVRLYKFYSENVINVPAKRSDAIRNITKLLNNGNTTEDLAGAVEDYIEKGIGDRPFHPNNFFGQKEYYKGFGKYAK
jgi:hypothetical protein